MERYWIWLAARKGLSDARKLRLAEQFGSPRALFLAPEAEILALDGLNDGEKAALLDRSLTEAEAVLSKCEEQGIGVLAWDDDRYPALLREIPDPPLVLYWCGSLPDFDKELLIAVVGHRKPTQHGEMMARKLGFELSRAGCVVVSGGAAGIDAAAMEGALRGGSPVVGVLGCGPDIVYPRRNAALFDSLREYGCLISEYPPETPPLSWHFPVRNRILSGLSRGVLVVEAPKKSGALITARLALEQGRDVFAVPGNAGMELCAGTNDLLRQGAACTEFGSDVLSEYLPEFPERLRLPDEAETASYLSGIQQLPDHGNEKIAASDVQIPESFHKKDVDNPENRTYIDVQKALPQLGGDEAAVLLALDREPLQIDDLLDRTGLPAPQVLGALTLLEIGGFSRSLPGGGYCLAYQERKDSEES